MKLFVHKWVLLLFGVVNELPHLSQPSFATPLFISAAIEASNLKFVLNLCSESSKPKTTFRTKFGRGLSQGSIAKIVGPPTYFYNR